MVNFTNTTIRIFRTWRDFQTRSLVTVATETSSLLLIGLIAIGGNLLVFISVHRNRSLRTVSNYFVVSLALTDIMYPTLVLPFTLAWSVKGFHRSVFTKETCNFQALLIVSLVYLSTISIAFMAINRYVRVCNPHRYKRIFNKKNSCFVLGFAWIATFAGATFVLKGSSLAKAFFSPSKMICMFAFHGNIRLATILGTLAFIFCVLAPLLVMFFCYFRVFKKIQDHKRNIAPSSNGRSLGTSVQEVKITWTLFAVCLGYLLSWLPPFVIIIVGNNIGSGLIPRQVQLIATYTGLSSSAVNPIIYGAMNPAFRNEYAKIFRRK